jgi:hypothetical protein
VRSELAVYKSKLCMLGAQGRGPGLRAKLPLIAALIVADDVRAVTRA